MNDEKILLVEDNKALSKLIAKKIIQNINFEVDVAHSLEEAKILVRTNQNYFLALLDLNLPDAPDGEVVDYCISKKIPSIVLTANVDKQTRESILKKNIIDYVFKGNMDDINYIFSLIQRLSRNREHKVMIVDDSIVTRNHVKRILEAQMYNVFCAAHGEEALVYLKDNSDIKLIITDYHMPVIDGFELTKMIREQYSKVEIGVIAFTINSDEMISSKFLKIGANDFIHKPFTNEELVCRVNNTIESLEYIETISDMANTDFLTGVSNRRHFFKEMKTYIEEVSEFEEKYVVAMLDIDKFKNVNDTYSHDAGDLVIKNLANILKDGTKGSDLIARFGGEEFCVVLKNISKEKAVEFFVRLRLKVAKSAVRYKDDEIQYTVSIGVAFSGEESIEESINEADLALYRAKQDGRNRVEISR